MKNEENVTKTTFMAAGVDTGKGVITIWALLGIWSVAALTSLPGLAVSPILDKLATIFPKATDLDLQLLTTLPSLLIIPFILFAGYISNRIGYIKLLYIGLWLFLLSGALYFVAGTIGQLIAVSAMLDGTRPFLIEVQSLVSTAAYGTPQRSATGFDVRRLNMLLAVLEKRAGFKLSVKDVFLNMAGGLKVSDPACDLAVIAAVLSSNFDFAIPSDVCFAGEIGLSGEVRPVAQTDRRIIEAARLGFKRILATIFASGGITLAAAR